MSEITVGMVVRDALEHMRAANDDEASPRIGRGIDFMLNAFKFEKSSEEGWLELVLGCMAVSCMALYVDESFKEPLGFISNKCQESKNVIDKIIKRARKMAQADLDAELKKDGYAEPEDDHDNHDRSQAEAGAQKGAAGQARRVRKDARGRKGSKGRKGTPQKGNH